MKAGELLKRSSELNDECRILPEGDYIESAVLMTMVEVKEELHFLFEKRAKNIQQGGEISFPGGKIDKEDKSPEDTAVRETIEELGVNPDTVKVDFKLGYLISPRGVIVHAYVGRLIIDDLEKIAFDKNEVEKIFTIPVSFFEKNPPKEYKLRAEIKPYTYNKNGEKVDLFPAEKLKLPKRYWGKWSVTEHCVLVYPTEDEIVWGLTAKLINEFINLIKKR